MIRPDVLYALRQLRRNPRFTAAAVITLALGTGATTAVFTVTNAVLFRDLPYREPQQLIQLWNNFRQHGMERVVFSHLEFLDFRERTKAFQDLAVYAQNTQTLKAAAGEAEQIWVSDVSPNLFDLLGVRALHGRTFTPEESEPGRGKVIVLSYALWQQRFGGEARVVGTTAWLQGEPYTIVGVMPRAFRSPATLAEAWRPVELGGDAVQESQRGSRSLWMIGRLRQGVQLDVARRETAAIGQQIARERPQQYPEELGYAVTVVPLHEEVTGDVRRALLILLGAVAMVMLIACVNVANLLLTRATDRHAEMAMRAALGASRRRLVSQVFTESLVLGILGGVVGTLLALWGVEALLQVAPVGVMPRLDEVQVSAPVFWFSLALSLVASAIFGIVPALQSSSTSLVDTLKDGQRSTRERSAIRRSLVVAEVALALVLLAGAGLLIRSFARLTSIAPGFDAANALTMRISLPAGRYPGQPQQQAFFDGLVERTRALPGVQAVGLVTSLPFSGWRNDWSISLASSAGREPTGALPSANYFVVNAEYFQAMGIPLLQGRGFAQSDGSGTPAVIVNSTLAERFWPGQPAIGRRLKMSGADSPWPWRTIVGVVGDVRQTNLETAVMPETFVLDADARKPLAPAMFLVVRASGDPLPLAGAIRRTVASIDSDQAVSNIRMLSERVSLSFAERRFQLLLLAAFAVIALSLAAVGVYGVIACSVAQRTREIGVRVALGAQRKDVLRLVIGQGMWLTGTGVALGVVGALGLSRYVEALLFETAPTDPATLATVALLLLAIALGACWIPARRASRLDPIHALRQP